MPNLFSKISSLNGTINLFSGGKQIKSLVPLKDVVRCFKFMAENEKINKETFHLTKDASSVKEVAEILCKVVKKGKKFFEVPTNYNGRTREEGKKIRFYHILPILFRILLERIKQ